MLRKTALSAAPFVLAAVVAVTACGGPPPAHTTGGGSGGSGGQVQTDDSGKIVCRDGSPGAAGDSIRFGVTAELTGKAALSGASAKRSLDLAVDQINTAGGILGRKVAVVYEDNQSTNPGAVNALQKLITQDNVFAVIGPIRSTQVQALTPIIKQNNIPMMIGGTNPTLTDNGGGLLFRFRPPDSLAGKAIVKYAEQKFNARRLAVLHDSDAFGTAGAQVVKDTAAADGVQVRTESYTTGDKDYTAQLTSLKGFNPDVFVTYMTNSEDLVIAARQYRELGMTTIPVVGSPSVTSEVSFRLGPQQIQDWYAVVDFLLGANDVNQKFAEEYQQRYRTPPDVFGAWQRDALYTMKAALERSGCDRAAFAAKLHETADVAGVQGALKAQPNGDMNTNLFVVQVKGGKAEKVADATALIGTN